VGLATTETTSESLLKQVNIDVRVFCQPFSKLVKAMITTIVVKSAGALTKKENHKTAPLQTNVPVKCYSHIDRMRIADESQHNIRIHSAILSNLFESVTSIKKFNFSMTVIKQL
jgi:hypothetical protein